MLWPFTFNLIVLSPSSTTSMGIRNRRSVCCCCLLFAYSSSSSLSFGEKKEVDSRIRVLFSSFVSFFHHDGVNGIPPESESFIFGGRLCYEILNPRTWRSFVRNSN